MTWFQQREAWYIDFGAGEVLTAGEWEAQCGPIFGHAFLVASPRPGGFHWWPSECDECGCAFAFLWCNYNYRCCVGCWNIIERQLWYMLEEAISAASARIVWSFLLEPACHGL